MTAPLTPLEVLHFGGDSAQATRRGDQVVTEEPLEIRIDSAPFQVTLRTPGADRALVAGLLFAEGIIEGVGDLRAIEPILDPGTADLGNVMGATLAPSAHRPGRAQARSGVVSAACGLCGKTYLDALA
ncbi:MAG TPA: formate dehydrogenase accessory sulfurtransferase FdhD, partial [bacterium]|nr:formate dehydrogenase accessory sulfurtransferase FdhD [bacterium]